MASANLVNFLGVTKAYGERPLLAGVSLGVNAGERIGIVGRNGAGKTTLLRLLAGTGHPGAEQPDTGRIAHTGDARVLLVSQADANDPTMLVREVIGGNSGWERDARAREIIASLLGPDLESAEAMLDRPMGGLSGGERRRAQLAAALIAGAGESDASTLLLLDEPTNHLDIEAVAWLAEHLRSRPRLALAVVTHDRWFLDEVSERTWEVVDGSVEEYDGGYSAYVLAKAERSRQAAASEQRRQNLLRKELAWLRRGAPARTSKPKFRIDAANELIANEPPPRDSVELLAFANARLGKTVFELHDATISAGERVLADRVTLDIGPGQRLGILGPNGAGKTTLIRVLLGQVKPSAGRLVTGSTVKPAFLSQHLDELDPTQRVLESVEHIAQRVELGKGRELTASQLCERLGFGADGQWTPVGDLSGGERRRLQLIRLLMGGPNVLVLDEPTNDFDVETLAALEDLLDGFAGTLIVVSHDRYFLERACDGFLAITGGQVRDLPRGIDEYLERRARATAASSTSAASAPARTQAPAAASDGARKRQAGKDLARLERQIAKLNDAETKLHEQLAEYASDYAKAAELDTKLRALVAERDDLEAQWLEAAEHA